MAGEFILQGFFGISQVDVATKKGFFVPGKVEVATAEHHVNLKESAAANV
jgi:hypothetical protein